MLDIGTALLCAACSYVWAYWQIYWARRTYAQPAGSRKRSSKTRSSSPESCFIATRAAAARCGSLRTWPRIKNVQSFRSLHDTEPPNSSSRPLLQRHPSGSVVQEVTGGCGHACLCRAGAGDKSASAIDTHTLAPYTMSANITYHLASLYSL